MYKQDTQDGGNVRGVPLYFKPEKDGKIDNKIDLIYSTLPEKKQLVL